MRSRFEDDATSKVAACVVGQSADGSDVQLVPLGDADALRLADVFATLDPWAAYGIPASGLARYLVEKEAGAPRFAICIGDDVAGAVGLRFNWLRGPYLQFLGLEPAFQGRNIGTTVLAWIEAEARSEGRENVWVMVSKINARGRAFYETAGFIVASEIPDLVVEGRTEILMRKRLVSR